MSRVNHLSRLNQLSRSHSLPVRPPSPEAEPGPHYETDIDAGETGNNCSYYESQDQILPAQRLQQLSPMIHQFEPSPRPIVASSWIKMTPKLLAIIGAAFLFLLVSWAVGYATAIMVVENRGVRMAEDVFDTKLNSGHWSPWSSWSPCVINNCSVKQYGSKSRNRKCVSLLNPAAECNDGEARQSKYCEVKDSKLNCSKRETMISKYVIFNATTSSRVQAFNLFCSQGDCKGLKITLRPYAGDMDLQVSGSPNWNDDSFCISLSDSTTIDVCPKSIMTFPDRCHFFVLVRRHGKAERGRLTVTGDNLCGINRVN